MDDLRYAGPRERGTAETSLSAAGAKTRRLIRWLPLALLAAGLAGGYAFGLDDYFSLDRLRRSEAALSALVAENGLGAAVLYAVVYIVAVALSFPGASFLTIAGGFLFGAGEGTALALVSATIGATLIFLAARTSVGDFLAGKAGPRMQRLRDGFQQDSFSYLLFLRLAPIFPFWLVNLAAALFGMRLLPYVLATAIGILPGTFVFSYFGQSLRSALGGEGTHLPSELFVGLALLAVMALLPAIVRRWRQRGRRHGEAAS
jgi:uncharacterized membrane protein YdjX (TVP38/TMEM64 family)